MEVFNEYQIDQMLKEEIAKLRTVISYIEDTKAKSETFSADLSEMKSKYESLSRFKVDVDDRFAKIDVLIEKRISESRATLRDRLASELATFFSLYKKSLDMLGGEVDIQKKTIKRLRFYVMVSLLLAGLSFLDSSYIRIIARELASLING